MKNGLGFSIVMAEDDEDDRIFIDEAFNEIGYGAEIKKFTTGEGLLRYLGQIDASVYPSLIVLDNTLPTLTATELLSILKKDPNYRGIPVVIYSGSISPQRQKQLLQMGAYSCVEKKSTMTELIALVKELKSLAEKNK